MSLSAMKKQYLKAQAAYYAGKPIMKDTEFDMLEKKIREEDPAWAGLRKTGSEKINKKRKVTLERLMPSLSKCYPHQIDSWLSRRKGPWLIMPKLDGSSVQVVYDKGRIVQMVTRGNGVIGQDITFLAKYTTLPQVIRHKQRIVLRFEALMDRQVWAKHYSKISENPRNLVAGILNRKLDGDSTQQLRHVRFVVLGVFDQKLREGLAMALALGFEVIHHALKRATNAEYLRQLLVKRRTSYQYEMDGLVVAPANQVFDYVNEDRPDWATAFKENLSDDEAPIASVKQVIWQISHNGRWTPKVEIEPVRLDGVTIRHATVHNAKWLMEHGIGAGAKIRIVRSGGVIPKIVGVVKKAKVQLPDGPTHWKGRYLYADEDTEQEELVEYKKAEHFLKTCGIEGIKLKTIQRMKLDIIGLCKLSYQTDSKIENALLLRGFGDVQSANITKELAKFRNNGVTLHQLLIGMSVFTMSIGDRKLNAVAKVVPLEKLVEMEGDAIRRKLEGIRGFGDSTIEALAAGIVDFWPLYQTLKKYVKIVKPKAETKAVKGGKFSGWTATWTGYRSKDEEAAWAAGGGEVVPFGSKTKVLFYKEGGKTSSKITKAEDKGIAVMTWSEVERRAWKI